MMAENDKRRKQLKREKSKGKKSGGIDHIIGSDHYLDKIYKGG